MLRILHTADWHLGQRLHGQSREYEHQAFLDWLLAQLQQRDADALIVAGDIFDSANPPISAQRQFYGFLTRARTAMPDLEMLFIGGNHDSAARLESIASLLDAIGVRMIGAISLDTRGRLDCDRMLVPLHNASGEAEVLCAAMPYLRAVDLPRVEDDDQDTLVAGVRARYRELIDAAIQGRQSSQALLATGHCYMVQGRLSERSERRILGGNQHALPLDIFPGEVDYVALGHLHLGQALREHIRYSGSPLPLSLAEKDYAHQLLQVDFDAGERIGIRSIPVPRVVEVLRIPESGPDHKHRVWKALEEMQLDDTLPGERYPWLEVRIRLQRPEPGLWQQIEALLADRPVRFLKLSIHQDGDRLGLGDHLDLPEDLSELDPLDVFRRCYGQRFEGPPPAGILDCFGELLESVQERR